MKPRKNSPKKREKSGVNLTTQSKKNLAVVGVLMGSDSDLKWMQGAIEALKKFKIPFETKIISAHRTPAALESYAKEAATREIRVIIAGAGGSAHLPGMVAANTFLPVIGVPCPVGPMQGEDALWSIVQMPKGVPVATVAIGSGWNAGILAAQILSAGEHKLSESLRKHLLNYKLEMEELVGTMNANLVTKA